MLAKQTTKIITTSEDLTDNEKIKNEYYPEMEAWLKEVYDTIHMISSNEARIKPM
jgi:hypothetical protein